MAGQAKRHVCDRSLRDSEIIDIVYADNFSDIPSEPSGRLPFWAAIQMAVPGDWHVICPAVF